MPGQVLFPRRGFLLVMADGKGVVPFAGNDDFAKAQLVKLLPEGFRDEPRVQGERNLSDLDVIAVHT